MLVIKGFNEKLPANTQMMRFYFIMEARVHK